MHGQIPGARFRILAVFAVTVFAACADEVIPPADGFAPEDAAHFNLSPPAPAGLVTVAHGGNTVQLWPFTGQDLAGSQSDPMNLIFTGEVDVVSLRSALMALDGDRTAFSLPNVFPFNCTWSDAFGDVQTTYSDADGWVANPVQLQCGVFSPIRFHLRLFEAGPWVLGGAHFEVLVAGTTEHQVLSWELAEQLVMVDMLRIGAVPAAAAFIYPAPTYREILMDVYNGVLSDSPALIAALGYPLTPQSANFPIPTDGYAPIMQLATRPPVVPGTWTYTFTISWDGSVPIPHPFCDANVYVLINGPVQFQQWVTVSGSGNLDLEQVASGELEVTPLGSGGTPGGPFRALVQDRQQAVVGSMGSSVQWNLKQLALPPAQNGSLSRHLNTSPNGGAHFTERKQCG